MHYADLLLRTDVRLAESPFFLANLAVSYYILHTTTEEEVRKHTDEHTHTLFYEHRFYADAIKDSLVTSAIGS